MAMADASGIYLVCESVLSHTATHAILSMPRKSSQKGCFLHLNG